MPMLMHICLCLSSIYNMLGILHTHSVYTVYLAVQVFVVGHVENEIEETRQDY